MLIMGIALFACKPDAIEDILSQEDYHRIADEGGTLIQDAMAKAVNDGILIEPATLCTQVATLEGVTSAKIASSGDNIIVYLDDGRCVNFLLVYDSEDDDTLNEETAQELSQDDIIITKSLSQEYNTPKGDKKALILAPMKKETDWFLVTFGPLVSRLEEAGYDVDKHYNEKATIDRFRGDFLSQYDVVIIQAHGGGVETIGTKKNLTGILTGTEYNLEHLKKIPKKEREGLSLGAVTNMFGKVKGFNYVVTSDWIRTTTTKQFKDSWIFVVSCATTKRNDMYSTFFSLGAGAYSGFSCSVLQAVTGRFMKETTYSLLQGKSLLDATTEVRLNNPLMADPFQWLDLPEEERRFDAKQKNEDIPFFLVVPEGYQRIPSVITKSIETSTQNSASISCGVTFEGAAKVTTRGVCWSTSQTPTIANSKTKNGTGLGTYTSNITGLSPNTTYYVRAYATNSEGTAYGGQRNFTTTAEQTIPTVITGSITNISTTTATCSGDVTADGGSSVTARGVCWSTSQNPTTANSKTTNGTGLGTYTSNITGLSPNTTYYVRAYATNSEGTAYGEQRSFKTNQGAVGDTFTDSRDGNVYKTVTIGNQTWMAQNLAYLPSVVGPGTGSYTTPYYYVYGYNGTNVSTAKATDHYNTYGVLYNWPAALTACPAGWHLPSDAEWTQLENYLADNGHNYDGTTDGGRSKIAKSLASASGWNSYSGTGAVGNTDYPAYRNKSSFTALPGGSRDGYGTFGDVGYEGYWWSSTEGSTSNAWFRYLHYGSSSGYRNDYYKDCGFSVRCVRD